MSVPPPALITPAEAYLNAFISSQRPRIKEGDNLFSSDRIPKELELTRLVGGTPYPFSPAKELTQEFAVLFFMSGACTPTCTNTHLSAVVAALPEFLKRDIPVFVMVPNTRDVVRTWFRDYDEERLRKHANELSGCTEKRTSLPTNEVERYEQASRALGEPSAFLIHAIPDYIGMLGWYLGILEKKCAPRDLGLTFPRGVALLRKGIVLDAQFESDASKCTVSHPREALERLLAIFEKETKTEEPLLKGRREA